MISAGAKSATTRECEVREEIPHELHIKYRSSELGQDIAEYALLLGLLSFVAITAITLLNTRIVETFQAIADRLSALIS